MNLCSWLAAWCLCLASAAAQNDQTPIRYSVNHGRNISLLDDQRKKILIGYLPSCFRVFAHRTNESADNYGLSPRQDFEDVLKCMKMDMWGHVISGAVPFAIEVVNANPDLLPGYALEYTWNNTCGNLLETTSLMMNLWSQGAAFFLGPESHCTVVATMAAAKNLPMISHRCASQEVSNKKIYRTFARTIPTATEITRACLGFLRNYKWTKFSLLFEGDPLGKDLVVAFENDVHKFNSRLPPDEKQFEIRNITVVPVWRETSDKHAGRLHEKLKETYYNTRIYVVYGQVHFFRAVVEAMGELGLFDKGEYVMVFLEPNYEWPNDPISAMNTDGFIRDTSYSVRQSWSKPAMAKMINYTQYTFAIIPTPVDLESSSFRQFWLMARKYSDEEGFAPFVGFTKTSAIVKYRRYASYLYDAILLYSNALTELLTNETYINETAAYIDPVLDGEAIISRILSKPYKSIAGFQMFINENGDAYGNYSVLTKQPVVPNYNKSEDRYYPSNYALDVAAYFVDGHETKLPSVRFKDGVLLPFPDGVPKDEPDCGFRGEKCIKESDYSIEIVSGVLLVLFVIAAVVATFVYRNQKYEKELAGLIWKIDLREIQFHSVGVHSCDSVLESSKASLLTAPVSPGASGEQQLPTDLHGLAIYRGTLVAIKQIRYPKKTREITRATKIEMKNMRGMHHDNINSFMGIIVQTNSICVVREYCAKGSLFDVLSNEDIRLDQLFIASFVEDLLKGMIYIHDSEIKVHGNLKSTNCVISSRWTLQVSDYALHELRDGQDIQNEQIKYEGLLWTAPELLRAGGVDHPAKGTQKGDAYSFAVVLHEILTRQGPFELLDPDNTLSAKDVTLRVMYGYEPFRPSLEHLQCQNYVLDVLRHCWQEQPETRQDFRHIRQSLKPLFAGIMKRNIMDHMMSMMEKYQTQLEDLVDERTMELREEKKRTETLLHRMLPQAIANQLLSGQDVIPESYEGVTIYFSDIVGFTSLSAQSTPLEVVNFLNSLYTLFDRIIRRYDVYKVETIGDAYMVVSGLPARNHNHAGEIATMALHLVEAVKHFTIPHQPDRKLLLRIGLHTGQCVAGVVGKTMPRYCLFGDTVNTASRMESNGMPLKIHCSESTKNALESLGGYYLSERGLIPMKGKGEMRTFWLEGKEEAIIVDEIGVSRSPTDEVPLFPPKKPTPQLKFRGTNRVGHRGSTISLSRHGSGLLFRKALAAVECSKIPTVQALNELPVPITPGAIGSSSSPQFFPTPPRRDSLNRTRQYPFLELPTRSDSKYEKKSGKRYRNRPRANRNRSEVLPENNSSENTDSPVDFIRKRSMSFPDGELAALAASAVAAENEFRMEDARLPPPCPLTSSLLPDSNSNFHKSNTPVIWEVESSLGNSDRSVSAEGQRRSLSPTEDIIRKRSLSCGDSTAVTVPMNNLESRQPSVDRNSSNPDSPLLNDSKNRRARRKRVRKSAHSLHNDISAIEAAKRGLWQPQIKDDKSNLNRLWRRLTKTVSIDEQSGQDSLSSEPTVV